MHDRVPRAPTYGGASLQQHLDSDIVEIAERIAGDVQQLANKTVLFTGAGGFLGNHFMALFDHLNRHVMQEPIRVLGFDNFIASDRRDDDFDSLKGVEFRSHNVIEPLTVDEPVHLVIHAAAIASPVWYKINPLQTLDVATFGTRNMLELAKSHAARFLFFSSSEIYGNPDSRHVPTSENFFGHVACRGPRACYDEGKRVGETLCDIYHSYFGVPTVVVRPFNIYGPGLRERDYRVFPNFASRIKAGEPLMVYGSGQQTRTFCYVADAIVGFMLAALRGVPGEAYNIGNPRPEITMEELARLTCDVAAGGASYRVVDYPDGYPNNEPMRRCPDIQKAELHLSFHPQVSLEEGVRRFLSWTDRAYVGEAIDADRR